MEGQNFGSGRFQLGIDFIDIYSNLKVENESMKNCFVSEGWVDTQLIPSFISLYSSEKFHLLTLDFFNISFFFITQYFRYVMLLILKIFQWMGQMVERGKYVYVHTTGKMLSG